MTELTAGRAAELAEAALLEEVRATPKPGLVDLRDSGAHRDMDHRTFARSAAAVAPWLGEMFGAGLSWKGPLPSLFPVLRALGREAERAMLCATGGVNTHKGAIFTLGLLCGAAGYAYGTGKRCEPLRVLELSREMAGETLEAELLELTRRPPATHGEALFVRGGRRGIRGEAAAGFPALRETALPALWEGNQPDRERQCLYALLKLMTRVEDTTVLSRTGGEGLFWMRARAAAFLTRWPVLTDGAMDALGGLNGEFIRRNVSPGGCADLLSAGLLLLKLNE